jgi:hypothetical protein
MAPMTTQGPSPEKTYDLERPLSITYRNVADLRLVPDNPRRHTPNQIRQIARSIEASMFWCSLVRKGRSGRKGGDRPGGGLRAAVQRR